MTDKMLEAVAEAIAASINTKPVLDKACDAVCLGGIEEEGIIRVAVYSVSKDLAQAAIRAMQPFTRQGWRDISEAPMDGTPVEAPHLVRYLPYKPDGRRQMQSDGRWQEHNGYGWQNIDWTPSEFRLLPTPPKEPNQPKE